MNSVFKLLVYIIVVLSFMESGFSQTKFLTKEGKVVFEASVSSFEEIKGTNDGVSAILNTENGEIAALALIRGFRFKIALMEEHFNENYIESQKYPKATFKGKLTEFVLGELSEKPQKRTLEGLLTIRGKATSVTTTGLVKQVGNVISLKAKFKVDPADFDIEIPKIVRNKIADAIWIQVDLELKKR